MTESSTNKLRVLDIVDGTIVDGPGLRTSIYFAGCDHRCPGCHNPQSWDFGAGQLMDIDKIVEHVVENDFNVTLTGGDPLYQIDNIISLCHRLHGIGKTIWCYTGFRYEDIVASDRLRPILDCIDVLVDGPFVAELRDISLHFRGSSNQRLIDVKKSNPQSIVMWE